MSDKKITLIEDDESTAEIEDDESTADLLKTMVKTLEAMDWKLWELYQTAQRVEKYLGITKDENDE